MENALDYRRCAMRVLVCCITVLCAITGAGGLNVAVSVDGSTFIQYEPVYVDVTITNADQVARIAPSLPPSVNPSYLDVRLVSLAGDAFPTGTSFMQPKSFNPKDPWNQLLAPGESQRCRFDAAEWTGLRDFEQHGFYCLPAGTYRVEAEWRLGLLPRGKLFAGGKAVSGEFVIREPAAGDETRAMRLFAMRQFYQWGSYHAMSEFRALAPQDRKQASERRCLESALALLRDYPHVRAFSEPTLGWFIHHTLTEWDRARARNSPESSALADSAVARYRSLIEGHPDSPTAVFWLVQANVLDMTQGPDSHQAYLADLAERLAGTRVGLEAKRVLFEHRH
jgi:hypothetical protein